MHENRVRGVPPMRMLSRCGAQKPTVGDAHKKALVQDIVRLRQTIEALELEKVEMANLLRHKAIIAAPLSSMQRCCRQQR